MAKYGKLPGCLASGDAFLVSLQLKKEAEEHNGGIIAMNKHEQMDKRS